MDAFETLRAECDRYCRRALGMGENERCHRGEARGARVPRVGVASPEAIFRYGPYPLCASLGSLISRKP